MQTQTIETQAGIVISTSIAAGKITVNHAEGVVSTAINAGT